MFLSLILTLCQVQDGKPDPKCTPGEITLVTKEQICSRKTASVRKVTKAIKKQVVKKYNVNVKSQKIEIDHLIPLELGGANSQNNLWPQTDVFPGFHEKDRLENKLHRLVCSGRIPLEEAQKTIAKDWVKAYFNL